MTGKARVQRRADIDGTIEDAHGLLRVSVSVASRRVSAGRGSFFRLSQAPPMPCACSD